MVRIRIISQFIGVCLAVCLSTPMWASSPLSVASVDPLLGPPPTGGGDSWNPILTPDGRYVLFASSANNLAVGSNGVYQPSASPAFNVFLRDRAKGTTILVSVNVSGTGGGNGDSFPTAISTNGQFALFESSASDLVTNDANNAIDVFVRDMVNNQTFLVSAGTNGQSGSGASKSSTMTPDARYIAFSSVASNLVAGDVNGITDVFVRDIVAGTTTIASVGATTGLSDSPIITPDGHYVAFLSTATGLVSGDTVVGDVYVRDLIGLNTVSATVAARSGAFAYSFFFNHSISDDGQYVIFESGGQLKATIFRYNLSTQNLDVVSSNGVSALTETVDFRNLDTSPDGRFVAYVASPNSSISSSVYLWDGEFNTTTLISGQPGVTVENNSFCAFPAVSSNGVDVTFLSTSLELNAVTSNTTTAYHLYRWNLDTGSNLVDLDVGGGVSFDTFMSRPCMTPDGRFTAFDATDSNLGGDPVPSYYNVYLSDQTTNTIEVVSSRQPNLPSATARALNLGPVFSVSSNGQYVAYSSVANRIAAGASNGFVNIFVGDLINGSNLVASLDTNGVADPDFPCADPFISANGRYIAFTSRAGNLVTNPGIGHLEVFLRDMEMGSTALVSEIGGVGANGDCFSPMPDATGRYVLFSSVANDLDRGDNGSVKYIYFRDMQSGGTVPVPGSNAPAMTPDGHYVAFGGQQICIWDSQSQSLVYSNAATSVGDIAISEDGNRLVYTDGVKVYGVDRASKSNRLIATATSGSPVAAGLQFSGDGRYVIYATTAAPAVNDTNNATDIYRYDFQANTNLLISQNAGAVVGNAQSDSPAISWDGRFVAYRSFASNLVTGAASAFPQIYLFDSQSGVTSLVSVSALTGAPANSRSRAPIFSGDSTTLFFQSWASDILTNDFSGSGGIYAVTVAVYPPTLLGAIQIGAGGLPVIIWPAASGNNYQVQYKDNLFDPTWLPLPGGVTVISNTGSITDSLPNSPQRFYRIQSN